MIKKKEEGLSSFFDEFGANMSRAGRTLAKKSKRAVESAKQAMNTGEDRQAIERLYTEIGRLSYEKHKDDAEPEFPEQFQIIREAEKRIAAYEKTQAASGGKTVCPKCGAEVPADSAFCPKCGCRMKPADAKTGQIECPRCHAMNAPDSVFCIACGAPLSKPDAKPAEDADEDKQPETADKPADANE